MTSVNVILIVSASICGSVSHVDMQVQSIQEFVTHKGDDVNNLHLPSIIAVCVALGEFRLIC